MKRECMLGVDIGTSGCKVLMLSPQGDVISTSFRPYNTYYPCTMWAEQSPEEWYEAFKLAVRQCLEKANLKGESIIAIGLDGMMNSPTFVGEKGDVLRRSIIWMDQRSVPQVEWLRKRLGTASLIAGSLSPTALLPKICWVKENQPELWKNVQKILLPKDYIRLKLTNSLATDWTDASATLLFDLEKETWNSEICSFLEIEKEKLPLVLAPTEHVGHITRRAAREVGLLEGTPVFAGCADAAADALAAGAIYVGQCLIRLGTCGALFVITDQLSIEQTSSYYVLAHAVSKRWMLQLITPAGLPLKWFQETFGQGESAEQMAKRVLPGSEGLFFLPYLTGEHTPRRESTLAGGFVGITHRHKKAHFIRAIYEGVTFSLRECFELLREANPGIRSIKLVGGGGKSRLWRSIISDVLNVEVEVPLVEDASFGAAILAGVGVGVFRDFRDAASTCVRMKECIAPNPKNSSHYNTIYHLYTAALDRLQDWLQS